MKATLFFFTLLSLGSSVSAMPKPEAETAAPAFVSFEAWVTDMIEHPERKHLTADEAFEANRAMRNETGTGDHWKRVPYCYDEGGQRPAPGRDAVACINYLASIGTRQCTVYDPVQVFRRIGRALMWGAKAGQYVGIDRTDTCQNAAITVGRIMDRCWRADDTVMGFEMVVNGQYGVGIARSS